MFFHLFNVLYLCHVIIDIGYLVGRYLLKQFQKTNNDNKVLAMAAYNYSAMQEVVSQRVAA